MRKFLLSVSMMLALGLLFVSCKKDSASNNNSNVPAGKSAVSCTYSGAASGTYSSDLSLSTCAKSSSLVNLASGSLTGLASVNQGMMILPLSISVGNHAQGTDGSADGITFSLTINNGSQSWVTGGATATGFTVNVTRNDATGIEGTFSGQLGNDTDNSVVTITNGTFKGTF